MTVAFISAPPPLIPPPSSETPKTPAPVGAVALLKARIQATIASEAQSRSPRPLPKQQQQQQMTPAEIAAGKKLARALRSAAIHSKWHRIVGEYPKSAAAATGRKRACIIRELVSTEKTYVASLTTLGTVFIAPLRELAATKNALLTTEQIAEIFGNVDGIRALNSSLLQQLEQRMQSWPSSTSVGDILLHTVDFLRIYMVYINRFSTATETLEKLRKSPKLEAWLAAASDTIPGSPDLSSFRVLPVQRLPRYKLLLEDLLRHTDPSHCDYDNLAKSLAKVKELVDVINERKRDTDSSAMVLEVQSRLAEGGPALLEPHRRFIRESQVRVETSAKGLSAKSPVLILFNDAVLLVDRLDNSKLKFKDLWPLSAVVLSAPDAASPSFQIVVEKPGSQRTELAVTAATAEEKAAWISEVARLKVADASRREAMYRSISVRAVPAWDADVDSLPGTGRKRSMTVSALKQQLAAEFSSPLPPPTPHAASSLEELQAALGSPAAAGACPPASKAAPSPFLKADEAGQRTATIATLAMPSSLHAVLFETLEQQAAEVARAQAAVCAATEVASKMAAMAEKTAAAKGSEAARAAEVAAVRQQLETETQHLKQIKELRRTAEARYAATRAQLTQAGESLVLAQNSASKQLRELESIGRKAQNVKRKQREAEVANRAMEGFIAELEGECEAVTKDCEAFKAASERLAEDVNAQKRELAELETAAQAAREKQKAVSTELRSAQEKRDLCAQAKQAQERAWEALKTEQARTQDSLASAMAAKASAHRVLLELRQAEEKERAAAAAEDARAEEVSRRNGRLKSDLAELEARLREEKKERKELEAMMAQLQESREALAIRQQQNAAARHDGLVAHQRLGIDIRDLASRHEAERLRCATARAEAERMHRLVAEAGRAVVTDEQGIQAVRALRAACQEKMRQAECVAESMEQFAKQLEETMQQISKHMRRDGPAAAPASPPPPPPPPEDEIPPPSTPASTPSQHSSKSVKHKKRHHRPKTPAADP